METKKETEQKNKTIKAKIYFYRYDISKKDEKKAYLKEMETAKVFSGWTSPNTLHYINFSYESNKEFNEKLKGLTIKNLSGEVKKEGIINIETKHLFNNQFNTQEGFRLWNWRENIFLNKDIKEGYYIEMPKEYFNLLENTFSCGYCGKQYTREEKIKKDLSFCDACLGSEYLKEDDLFLLRLKRINDKTERLPLNDCDNEILTDINLKEFERLNKIRKKENIKRIKAKLTKERKENIANSENEYKGFMWCLNKGIETDNLIYYNHTKTFCFGWRDKLNFEKEQQLKKDLKGFPFKFELKV